MLTLSEEMKHDTKRAAQMLDRLRPGWALRIDVGLLDMRSATHCVLGQVFTPPVVVWYRPWTWRHFLDLHGSGYSFALTKYPQLHFVRSWIFASPSCQTLWVNEIATRLYPVAEDTRDESPQASVAARQRAALTSTDSKRGTTALEQPVLATRAS